jgi:hypothetical protein
MPAVVPSQIAVQFVASSWAEVAFHELAGAGKLSRASITIRLSGELEGEGVLDYLLSYPVTKGAPVTFVGYERIVGRIGALQGSFVLLHDGVFPKNAGVTGRLDVVPSRGTGAFADLHGVGEISAKVGEHGGVYALTLDATV